MTFDQPVTAVVLVPLDSVDICLGKGAPLKLAGSLRQLPQNLLHEQVLLVCQRAPALRTAGVTLGK